MSACIYMCVIANFCMENDKNSVQLATLQWKRLEQANYLQTYNMYVCIHISWNICIYTLIMHAHLGMQYLPLQALIVCNTHFKRNT